MARKFQDTLWKESKTYRRKLLTIALSVVMAITMAGCNAGGAPKIHVEHAYGFSTGSIYVQYTVNGDLHLYEARTDNDQPFVNTMSKAQNLAMDDYLTNHAN